MVFVYCFIIYLLYVFICNIYFFILWIRKFRFSRVNYLLKGKSVIRVGIRSEFRFYDVMFLFFELFYFFLVKDIGVLIFRV